MKDIFVLPFVFLLFSVIGSFSQIYTSGNWTYRLNASNAAIIRSYLGPGGSVAFPATVAGYPVVQVGDGPQIFGYENTSVTAVTIPDGVTRIRSQAFSGAVGLSSVSIPNSVTDIEMYAFSGASLTSVVVPNSVTNMEYGVFDGCTSLTSATLGDGLTNIPTGTFYYCSSLTNVVIPSSVTRIDQTTFLHCTSLSNIIIPNSVTSIGGGAFYRCSFVNLVIPKNVVEIGEGAFQSCTNLINLHIGSSVAQIGGWAFYGCTSLTELVIPRSVMSIGQDAFSESASLNTLRFEGNAPQVGGDLFVGINPTGTVYYQLGASGWSSTFSGWPTEPYSLSPGPAIVVEQPLNTVIISQAPSAPFSASLVGSSSANRVFTLRNLGGDILDSIAISLSGSETNDFVVTTPLTSALAPAGEATFTVAFAPTSGGQRTSQLLITSNDTNNNPFVINLSGFALGENLDTDGDGLNDAAEFTMSALGFDWQSNQPTLVTVLYNNANRARLFTQWQYDINRTNGQTDVTTNPSAFNLFTQSAFDGNRMAGRQDVLSNPLSYGLYTSNSIMDLRMGGLMLQKQGSNAVVTFQPQTTTDLATQPFTNNGTPITNAIPMPGNKGFLRIWVRDSTPPPTP